MFLICVHYLKFWAINQAITVIMSIFYLRKMWTLSVEKRLLEAPNTQTSENKIE